MNGENIKAEKQIKVTATTLKIIAIITMFIDHIGVILLKHGTTEYTFCRVIGRLAFPIFCFLIIEGFKYTSNHKKYLFRLFIFALISEIPFDLALYNKIIYIGNQNVFFTLFLGLCNILLIDNINKKIKYKKYKVILIILSIYGFCNIANILSSDYSYTGILLINIYYLFKDKKIKKNIFSYILLLFNSIKQLIYFVDIILFNLYNGEKGKNINKYIFYIFYPAHLLILYLINLFIKIL